MRPEIQALLRQAAQLFRAGRYDEAIAAYEHLLAAEPALPNSWFNLAMAQRGMRRFADALGSYGRALALGIDQPEEVHLQRGVIFADDLGDHAAARAELEAALALNPAYLPAWLNLGNAHEDCGEWDAARAAYARALALAPEHPLALARMVALGTPDGADDPLLRRVGAALARPELVALDRADLGFALGAALDKVADYDAAFAAYAAANRAARATAGDYDRGAVERLVDRLIAAFPASASAPVARGATAPIFVCGMFRSGSTLVEQILARHSGIVAGGELDALPAIAAQLASYPESVAALPAEALAGLRDRYRAEADPRHPAGTALIDKRPDNFLHIGLIKTLFPDARIVHTARHPLDNALSVYFLHAGPQLGYATDLGDIAHYHAQQRRLMAHWRACYPDAIVEVDYERLVVEPRQVLEPVLEFLGLAWEDALLDHRRTGPAVRTASHWQIRQPLYQRSSGRWRHYRKHLDMLHDLL